VLFFSNLANAEYIVTFITASAVIVTLLLAIYSWSIRVEIADGILTKSSIFGKRIIPLGEIDEITHMSLMGRYVFLLITPTSYTTVSSLMENFLTLSERVKENVTEKAYASMGKITPKMLRKKNIFMQVVMILAIVLCFAAAVYTIIQ